MNNQIPVVLFVVNVESCPKVVADDRTSESQFFQHLDVFQAHSSQRKYMLVNEPSVSGFLQLVITERCFPVGVGNAVKNVSQKYIFRLFLRAFQFFERPTRA